MSNLFGVQDCLRRMTEILEQKGLCQIAGLSEAYIQLILLSAFQSAEAAKEFPYRNLIICLPKPTEVNQYLTLFDGFRKQMPDSSIGLLPYISAWGHDRYVNPNLSRRQRIYSLHALRNPSAPAVVLTTLPALMQSTLKPELYGSALLELKIGEEYDQDQLLEDLEDRGYRRVPSVEEEGVYAIRGGIIDVFPPSLLQPVRIEFIGDEIESMRQFQLSNQRSVASLKQVAIGPALEVYLPTASRKADVQRFYEALIDLKVNQADRDGMVSSLRLGVRFAGLEMFSPKIRTESALGIHFADPKQSLLIFPKSAKACEEAYEDFWEGAFSSYKRDLEAERPSLTPQLHYPPPDQVAGELDLYRKVEFGNPFVEDRSVFLNFEGRSTAAHSPLPQTDKSELFDKWVDRIRELIKNDHAGVCVLASRADSREKITNLLSHRGLTSQNTDRPIADFLQGKLGEPGLYLGLGDLHSQVWVEESQTLFLPEHLLFGRPPRKSRPASAKLQNYLSSFKDLNVGDLVVHVQHGIGRYKGMQTFKVGEIDGEFLILEYAGGDKIYLPVDKLNILQRYSSGDGGSDAAVDKLGGQTWERKRAGVKKAVKDMADELLKLQAKRKLSGGHVYHPPPDIYYTFEEEFPFQETEDQLKALADVDADLTSSKPVDRLICGDVGFGKTEVALRATMRAVLEGYQVLVLVPTTVLCYQHYTTFRDRLAHHGVNVAQINRFVRSNDSKDTLKALSEGRLDVLVGTHRILSKDIKPKRLGLMIVDEEQRFGVTHKERLKHLRAQADILTLTATPIPRTLHMAMLGLRDISIIATPPQDRLSVRTYIAKFEENLIKEAISQEVARGGQVFFVHNRVQDIEEMRTFLRSLVPDVKIEIAHGQMRETQLEKVIVDFMDQKFSVLLCTTIIESGVDMPNVNTLIVNRADRFGLAQLYQIRGRVGRSNVQAYAYFLTPTKERLTDEARQRLDVLGAHQELGAGFHIASHDLEIRGAGNLLGAEQSGHISAVGLEMYTHLLDEAIAGLQGQPLEDKVDTELKLPVSAMIPDKFIPNANQRLQLYKSLFSADTEQELAGLQEDVRDRYGELPEQSANLFSIAKLKMKLRHCRVASIKEISGGVYELKFGALLERQIAALRQVSTRDPEHYQLTPDFRLLLRTEVAPGSIDLDQLIALVDPLNQALSKDKNA